MRKHVAMTILITLWYPITVFVHSWYIYICTFFRLSISTGKKKHGADFVDQTKDLQALHDTSNLFVKLHALFAQSYNPIFKTHPKAITTSMLDKTIGSAPLPFHPHRNLTKHCFVLIYPVLGWGFGVRVGFPFLIGKSVCEEITIDDYCHPFPSITNVDNLQI